MLKWISKNKHFLVLLYYFVMGLLYKYTERITVPKYIMHTTIDDFIPFVKEMVISYTLWYFYIIGALIYLGFTAKEDFYKLTLFMFGGMTICYIIYMILPNGQDLRPAITQTDIFSTIINNLYINDTPTNSAPSMHVLDSIAVHLALIKNEKLKDNKWIKYSSAIIMLSIVAATVMIKQHSIIDDVYATILSYGLYVVIYKVDIIEKIRLQMRTSKKKLATEDNVA